MREHLMKPEAEFSVERSSVDKRRQNFRELNISGGDAPGGHTRSHPEHDG